MLLIDTHTHLYLEHFDNDRSETVQRAIDNNVKCMLLPNIDAESIKPMMQLAKEFPHNLLPMIGLHPTSVKADYKNELAIVDKELKFNKFCAIGETGIDLYWDTTFEKEQKEALRHQIILADTYNLPIVLHSRNSLTQIVEVIEDKSLPRVGGVFHCYPGDTETALKIVDMGFYLGIGGTVTYKKTDLPDVIKAVGLKNIVLETDAPFLPPVPYRGKRNESMYVKIVAEKIAEILNVSLEEVAEATSCNAIKLFNLNQRDL